MEKDIRNVDAIARKLRPVLTKVTNQRLEIAKEEKQKREEIMEKWKAKIMIAKYQKARRGITLSSNKKDENDTGNETNPDQAGNSKYLLQLQEVGVKKSYK